MFFSVQKRLADHHFAKAESFEEIVAAHDRFVAEYNTQEHFAHQNRKDSRYSPSEILGWLVSVRHIPEELERAFFSVRFTRTLDASGYARIHLWRVYCEEGLAKCDVALWLGEKTLTVDYAGQSLARYDVEYAARTGTLREVKHPTLFETSFASRQPRLFRPDVLGEDGGTKALELERYAPRRLQETQASQWPLFAQRSSEVR